MCVFVVGVCVFVVAVCMFVVAVCLFVVAVCGESMCVFGRVLVVDNANMIDLLLYEIGNEECLNVRYGLCNARQAILHEGDYPWVARAIRGWPGSATGAVHSQAIHGSATGPEHSGAIRDLATTSAGQLASLLRTVEGWRDRPSWQRTTEKSRSCLRPEQQTPVTETEKTSAERAESPVDREIHTSEPTPPPPTTLPPTPLPPPQQAPLRENPPTHHTLPTLV